MLHSLLRLTFIFAAILATASANAQTLAFTCKDPTGRSLGILGELGKFKQIDEPDSFKGGVITLIWKLRENSAQITFDSDGVPLTTTGTLFFRSNEQASFSAIFPGAAYMFTIFLPGQRLLASAHQQFLSVDPGSAIAKTLEAKCDRAQISR